MSLARPTTSMLGGICAIALAATLLIAAIGHAGRAAAGGPNLLTNGSFDTDVAGWNPPGGNASLTFAAAEGTPPGAAQLALTVAPPPPYSAGMSQCVPATAGFNYTATMDVAGNTGSLPLGTVAFMTMIFNLAADCTGSANGATQSGDVTPVNSFQTTGVNLTAPAGTLGVLVVLFVYGSDPAGSEQSLVWFDNVSLTGGIDTPTPSPTPTATTTSSTPVATNTPVPGTTTPTPTSTLAPAAAASAPAIIVPVANATATRTTTPVAGATQAPGADPSSPSGGPGAVTLTPPDTGDGTGIAGARGLAALLSAAALVVLGAGLLVAGLRRR